MNDQQPAPPNPARRTVDLEAAARRIVEASCATQGIDVKISDPVTLGRVAAIFGAATTRPGRAPLPDR